MRDRAKTAGVSCCAAVALAGMFAATPAHGAGGTGTIAGTVRLAGSPPARPPMPVYKHGEVCGHGVTDDRLVVGTGGGVRYVVVTVEGVHGGEKPDPELPLTLDNEGCRFQPHVQVAEVGQWLEIVNSDPVLHNADARLGKDTIFNVGLPPGRHVRRQLLRPGMVTVTCDVWHTWMIAYIAVAENPYHSVTDAYGAYEIHGLPPGRYALRIWHEELGNAEKPAEVHAGRTTAVDFVFPALDTPRAASSMPQTGSSKRSIPTPTESASAGPSNEARSAWTARPMVVTGRRAISRVESPTRRRPTRSP